MLVADVLNSDALLNNFEVIKTLDFIAGSAFTLVIRLKQPQQRDKLRYIPASGATLQVEFPNKDGSELDLAMTSFPDDRSMWTVDITALQSEDLASGNFTFTLTEGMKVTSGLVENGLALVVTGGCCC